jgi:hypothetical protein
MSSTLYEAARNAGLLTAVTVAGNTVHCAFRAPDETVLDGFALSRDYQIDYPAAWLTLAAGDTVEVAGNGLSGARRARHRRRLRASRLALPTLRNSP